MDKPAPGTAAPSPIRHALIYVNPSPDSFDHAIVSAYVDEAGNHGQDVIVRDLYALGFNPVLRTDERPYYGEWEAAPDVQAELNILRSCDILVLVYPIWFGMPPAMLKGYVDRVLGAGCTLQKLQAQNGQPALKDKPLLSFSTSGSALRWLDQQGQVLSLREAFDVYLWRGFGMKQSEHIMIDSIVPDVDKEYAKAQLERVRTTAARTCVMLERLRTAAGEQDRKQAQTAG